MPCVVGTGFLVLLLQIPVGLIAHTIDERRMTRDAAVDEVTRTWGGSQELVGPILTVPSIERWLDAKGKPQQRTVVRHFLPRTLSVRGRAETEVRRRRIFDVPLFVAQVRIEGVFVLPDASHFASRAEDILWQRASLSYGIADPKAIRACSPLSLDARRVAFEPGPGAADFLGSGLHAPLPGPGRPGTVLPFAFDLTLGGSGRLAVVPVGDETVVALASPWRDPSFDGAWLPVERRVGAEGFEATWRVLNLGRNFPSSWVAAEVARPRLRDCGGADRRPGDHVRAVRAGGEIACGGNRWLPLRAVWLPVRAAADPGLRAARRFARTVRGPGSGHVVHAPGELVRAGCARLTMRCRKA